MCSGGGFRRGAAHHEVFVVEFGQSRSRAGRGQGGMVGADADEAHGAAVLKKGREEGRERER